MEEKQLPLHSWGDRDDKMVGGKRASGSLYREGNEKIQKFPVFLTPL